VRMGWVLGSKALGIRDGGWEQDGFVFWLTKSYGKLHRSFVRARSALSNQCTSRNRVTDLKTTVFEGFCSIPVVPRVSGIQVETVAVV
jgi:hypothetical protein